MTMTKEEAQKAYDDLISYRQQNVLVKSNMKSKTPLNLDDAKEIFAGHMSGPASKAVKSNRPFTLKEVCIVELPKGSMFSNGEERYVDLLEFDIS